jgi:hypothetical protein
VAYRTALHARDADRKRRAKEAEVPPRTPPAETARTELRLDLDQELERLPDTYRAALVLCDLEGRTRREAARRLGWPEGTVASRLAAARALLAKRLARYGPGASGGALAAVLSQGLAPASVPTSVVLSTVQAASLLAAGQAAVPAVTSPQVAALAEGAFRMMSATKVKSVVGALLVLGLSACGTGLLTGRLAVAKARPVVVDDRSPTLLFYKRAPAAKDGGTKPRPEGNELVRKDDRPRKLPKAPPPSPELQRELAALDAYRNGPEEKFAELERKADELLKRYASPGDQARIYFEVAHIAAQSDIRRQVRRVRRYAKKGLALSRDPLQRAWLFSYLGSAAEVDETRPFPQRRREAARELLSGYAEMLAQGAPKVAPELPGVDAVDNSDDPARRAREVARHAAQMAAREEAEFTRALVGRRDTLANQLKWLYRPDPNVYGRGPEGPDELRGLARTVLRDRAAVDALLAHVTAE